MIQKIILYFFLTFPVLAQQYFVSGSVKNIQNKKGLSFANIRVLGTTKGTAANIDGEYELKLEKGKHTLIASYIGFKSDTLEINLVSNKTVNFYLLPISLKLPEVTISPGKNPAMLIIQKAIEAKNKRNIILKSYIFKAYTKGLARSDKDFSASDNSVSISTNENDTTNELKIMGIIENESIGYFKKPDFYKDIIIARKQSSNTPSTINVITGGRLIQNFYNDELWFFNRPIPSPVAENALDYYYFYLEDSLAQDNNKVYKIYFAPSDASDPAFYGKIYISDSSFALLKVDVALNDAANPGKVFSKIHIFQQFLPFDQNIYMPVDYRMFVVGNYLGLVKFGFELNSIMYDYKINPDIKEDFFDMAIVTVLPDADGKDPAYWNNIQKIPNTPEEIEAYKRIDSLESTEKTLWDRISLFSERINWSDNISSSGTLDIYSFNKIEGHKLNFGIFGNNLFNHRFDFGASAGYGFADQKLKYLLTSSIRLGDYRTTEIKTKVFNNLYKLFAPSDKYRTFTSTLLSLFTHYDFRDYYYSKGFEININSEVLPVLSLSAGFLSQTETSAVNNTEFSFFRKERKYKPNTKIYDVKTNELNLGFKIDFRHYIENGLFRSRLRSDSYIIFEGKYRKEFSSLKYNIFNFDFYGSVRTFNSAGLDFYADTYYSNGPVPFQMLTALPGNINGVGKNYTFRTLGIGEVFGDRVTMIYLNHNFRDELFKLFKIPYVKDWQLSLSVYLNVAFSEISNKSKNILPVNYSEFKRPFAELGFGIGHALLPFKLEFTWKLNHRGQNNFVIGLNAIVL